MVNDTHCYSSCIALEDPFGDDITDLPLQQFCFAIETQLEAIYNDSFSIQNMHWPKKKLEIKEVMESVQDDLELGNRP